jgi:hypothetical protein
VDEVVMGSRSGCLKFLGFGCLGMIAIVVVLVGIAALSMRPRSGGQPQTEREFAPAIAAPVVADSVAAPAVRRPRLGLLVVDMAQGGFTIEPGAAGEGVHVEARYDSSMYELREDLVETDSTWVYTLHMRRTTSGLASILQHLVHGGSKEENELRVVLPPDMPVALDITVKQGGFDAEVGGCWITSADVTYAMGGFTLSVDEPLREPMQSLTVRGSMGGFEGKRLGNASPRLIDVTCSMGGAELDLRGPWRQDCDLRLDASMGGMEVRLPDGVRVEGVADPDSAGALRREAEVALPVLRFASKASLGEIEVYR